MTRQIIFLTIVLQLIIGPAAAESTCVACMKEKLASAKAKAVAATALGVLGGAKGGPAGAACGAVLGAVAAGVDALIELSQCETICKTEAAAEKEPNKSKCEELLTKVKH